MENEQNGYMSGGGSPSNYNGQYSHNHHNDDNIVPEKITLIDGKFIRDCQIPSNLLNYCKYRDDREFTHTRYTACTCDPDDFSSEGFTLRQKELRRQIELFIVVTMYNEDVTELSRTFHGIVENITSLCKRTGRIWNEDSWKKVVVCIVSDGRKKFHKSCLAYLTALGVYQDGVAIESINKDKIKAHIFEFTTQISIDQDMKTETLDVPIQVLFCHKENNAKKINSHRWFFNAFGPVIEPKICILIDVGTRPGVNSIYNLWETFNSHPYVAGACGEIVAMTTWYKLLNPIVGAQYFEYKMSNILDKPLESVFGYITVLPGAFSAYRYIALQNTIVNGELEGPLASYFMGEEKDENDTEGEKKDSYDEKKNDSYDEKKDDSNYEKKNNKITHNKKSNSNIFTANMYLAEDRILCFELVTKRKGQWLLHYVKSSQADTDIPKSIDKLISQRRRWLNGSFFASLYAVSHFYYILRSDHCIGRKFFLFIEMIYQAYNLFFSWFALGNFYLTFHILGTTLYDPLGMFQLPLNQTINENIFIGIRWVFFAWGTREEDEDNKLNKVTSHKNEVQVTSIDVADGYDRAWSTLKRPKENKPKNMGISEDEYRKRFRIYLVLLWVLSNTILVTIVISDNQLLIRYVPQGIRINAYVTFILWSVAGLAVFRFFGSLVYFIFELPKTLKSKLAPRRSRRKNPVNNV
ncbi:7899_t:CDS:2 [Dentiscutata erythropus]|uniref:Chitin synthase n=1 Tax=Dentiscutata erythropus TaxID=1348616 RepID=A0A9N9APT7_9GLOM|nr:7899_t:CDS:2 [Dentiscutata erythropus]